jgi:hypothetical protein
VIDRVRILRTLPRTPLARSLAVALSLALSQAVTPAVHAAPAVPTAPTHLVDASQMTARLLEAARTRDEKVHLFQDALATADAQAQARKLGQDPARLKAAVAHLSDKELEDLSQRAAKVKDVAAGHHPNDSLAVLGIVLLVAGLVVLIAVAADHDHYYDDCYCY